MRIRANAKINWTLDITEKLPTGFHAMDMLMQPITLHDTLTLTPSDTITLTVAGDTALTGSDDNLCIRAAKALSPFLPNGAGIHIHLDKRIPMGAGLGGGSADAAAVLKGLVQLYALSIPSDTLLQIGLTLGADIPFCLTGGLQRATGVGEVLSPLPLTQTYALLILKPEQELSTRTVFGAFSLSKRSNRPNQDQFIKALQARDWAMLKAASGNVLTPCSEIICQTIRPALTALEDSGAALAAMSGSGNAVFGVYDTHAKRDAAFAALKKVWQCYPAETTRHSLEIIG